MNELVPVEAVASKIYLIRGQKVILDADLAELYGVETKQLKRQVRRNNDRFPEDFMFVLTRAEYNLLRSQPGTLERGQHAKYLPMAFIEQGVAMLSGVLTSKRNTGVGIAVFAIPTKSFCPRHKEREK
ncbi:MAG: ORF6N domain-containing protein [Desulfobulbaceae bacterium]